MPSDDFVLAGQIGDIGKQYLINPTIVDTSTFSKNSKYINSSNAWQSPSTANQAKSINVPVNSRDVYVLESNAEHGAIYALLKSNTTVGNPVDFSAELDHRVVLSAGQKTIIEIPDDTTILYLFAETEGHSFLPSKLTKGSKIQEIVSDIDGNVDNKNTAVPNMVALEQIYKDELINVSDTTQFLRYAKYINSSDEWAQDTTTAKARSIRVSVNGGEVYMLESNAEHGAIYALLKSNTTVGNPVDFSAELDHRVVLSAGQKETIVVPSDTTLLYLFAELKTGEIFLPSKLTKLSMIKRPSYRLEPLIPRFLYKKGVMMGDSITAGVYSYFNNGERWNGVKESGGISDYIGEIIRCSVDNVGKRGTGYVADTRNINNALEQALITDYSQYDFCVMMYGVNDYIQGMPLGSIEENLEGTVVGNMSRVFNKILSDNPYCKILCVGSYNTWGQVSQGGDYISNHPYGDETTDYALGYVRSTYTLRKYLDTQKEVCEHYHVQYFCLADEGIVNLINIKNVLVDGLHPTLELRKYIAQEIAKKLV